MINVKRVNFLVFLTFVLFSFTEKTKVMDRGFNLKKFERSLVLIPKTEYQYGLDPKDKSKGSLYAQIIRYHLDSFPTIADTRTIQLDSFYVCKFEVSNGEYLEFLSDLRTENPGLYKRMLPDTIRDFHFYGEPFLENYHKHPAYRDYPAIGITYEQANCYCKWLTDKYMSQEKRKFKNVEFKLPTIGQWTYAAIGGKQFSLFPWMGWSMQNKRGDWRANFKVVEQYHIGKSSRLSPNQHQTMYLAAETGHGFNLAPVDSYQPNKIGLHNMAGNVEEFVREIGITKGGSWNDTGYYLQTWVEERYDTTNSASDERGFRFVMEVMK